MDRDDWGFPEDWDDGSMSVEEIDLLDPPPAPERRKSSLKRRLIKIGAVIVVVASIESAAAHKGRQSEPRVITCAVPSLSAKQEVGNLLGSPVQLTPAQAANKHHLAIHSAPDLSFRETTDDFYKTATTWLEQYGIELKMGDSDYDENGWSKPTDHQLNSRVAKRNIMNTVEGISRLPLEEIQASGLKRIILMYKKPSKVGAYVNDSGDHSRDTVVDNIAFKGRPTNIVHEDYHLLQHAECGRLDQVIDPAYTQLNGGNIYGHKKHKGRFAMYNGYYLATVQKRLSRMDGDIEYSNADDYCDQLAYGQRRARRVVVPSDYSFKEPEEDEAEVGSSFGDPYLMAANLNPAHPILRRKTELLLARLYDDNPAIARYLIDIALKVPPIRPTFDCDHVPG